MLFVVNSLDLTSDITIGENYSPFIVAEISANHGGDIEVAKKTIASAKESGADYAKFQTWSVKNLKPGPWDKDGRLEIYKKAENSELDHQTKGDES